MTDTQTPLWPGMEGLEGDVALHLSVGTLMAKLEQTRGIELRFSDAAAAGDTTADPIAQRWGYRCKGIEDSIEALIKAARR